ncbi:MAG: hypothetical protein K8R59_12055 [Thermoanaerobaculales bacterium]|nr:hypothetical protein [Thermoanaerobaculales bacterium]
MSRLVLISAGDDFLLEEALNDAVAQACAEMGEAHVERLSPEISPEDLAVEICSPSLFNPIRVLVAPDVRGWVKAPAPRDATTTSMEEDVSPLVRALEDGVPNGVALIMGAWCGGQPKGPLVEAVQAAGAFSWIAAPEPPKPWEDVAVSEAQRNVLRRVMSKAAPQARFASSAERLLLERLGFAPRRLAQESAKLAAAAGENKTIGEELVRRLVLPREGSLEVLQDALLERDPKAVAAFLDEARRGTPVRDWAGKRMGDNDLPLRVFNLAADTMIRMLYLRAIVRIVGAEADLDPQRCDARGWYSRSFKPSLGPKMQKHIEADSGSPFVGRSKVPKPWALHRLFRGAARYTDDDLVRALIEAGKIERYLRRSNDTMAALSGWLLGTLGSREGC